MYKEVAGNAGFTVCIQIWIATKMISQKLQNKGHQINITI